MSSIKKRKDKKYGNKIKKKACCVPGCTMNRKDIWFHTFPSQVELMKKWRDLILLQKNDPNWWPRDNTTLCSIHFDKEDYREDISRHYLKPGVVPSNFPSYPKHLQPKKEKKDKPPQQVATCGPSKRPATLEHSTAPPSKQPKIRVIQEANVTPEKDVEYLPIDMEDEEKEQFDELEIRSSIDRSADGETPPPPESVSDHGDDLGCDAGELDLTDDVVDQTKHGTPVSSEPHLGGSQKDVKPDIPPPVEATTQPQVPSPQVQHICRLCAKSCKSRKNLVDIFGSEGRRWKLSDKINQHLPIWVQEGPSALPASVCRPCVARLEACHELVLQVAAANLKLQQRCSLAKINSENTQDSANCPKASSASKLVEPHSSKKTEFPNISSSRGKTLISKSTPQASGSIFSSSPVKKSNISKSAQSSVCKTTETLKGQKVKSTSAAVGPVSEAAATKSLVCNFCDKSCKTQEDLKIHYFSLHNMQYCGSCNDVFQNFTSFFSHTCSSTNVPTPKFELELQDILDEAVSNQTPVQKKLFSCEQCDSVFKTQPALAFHTKVHDRTKCVQCDICCLNFSSENNLEHHNKVVHTEGKIFKCNLCGSTCFQKADICKHIRINHKNMKLGYKYDKYFTQSNIQCNLCKAIFTSVTFLELHAQNCQSAATNTTNTM